MHNHFQLYKVDIREFIQARGSNIKRHPWELARQKMLNFFITRCKSRTTILDIGSGDAFLSSSIAERYPDSTVTAIDINYTIDLVKEFSDNKPGNLRLLNSIGLIDTKNKTDIVILMDVLEHVEEPGLMLQEILNLPSITPNTTFIVTVPAYQLLFSQHDTALGHYKRYTNRTLTELLHSRSFKIENKGYCFNSLIMIRLLQLLKQKISGTTTKQMNGIHNWTGGKLLTSFITNLFWIEFKISWYLARIGIKIPGLTCYSICKHCPS